MNIHKHATQDQLVLLLKGGPDEQVFRELADHVESCLQCREALDAMAAEPSLWAKAPMLACDPLCTTSSATSSSASQRLQRNMSGRKTTEESIDNHAVEDLLGPPSHPELLGRIGDYDVESVIGRGGMGVVFKAYDAQLHRALAIKVLSPRLAENGAARQRFAREAQAAAAVIHPNVVAIHGVNATDKTPYMVMPYVAGPSLQHLVDEQGPLEEKEIVRIALQVSSALAAAHSQGLVHRDIKPANILIERDVSRVLVTDFGLARAVDDASMTQTGFFVGTPNYMSPEQAQGHRVDGRSDLFSLGSVLYFMASGHMPFRADSALSVLSRISSDQPTPLRQVNSDVSQTLCDIIEKLISKAPDDRFQSAGELHETLENHLAYLHQPGIHGPAIVTPFNERRLPIAGLSLRAKMLWAGACVVILTGIAYGLVASGIVSTEMPDDGAAVQEEAETLRQTEGRGGRVRQR